MRSESVAHYDGLHYEIRRLREKKWIRTCSFAFNIKALHKAARFLTLWYQANVKRDEDDRYCRRGSAILYAVVSIPIPERSQKKTRNSSVDQKKIFDWKGIMDPLGFEPRSTDSLIAQ